MPSDEVRRLLKLFCVAVTEFEAAEHQRARADEIRKCDAEVRSRIEEIESLLERLRRRVTEQ